ncbi:glutamate racemase [Flavobacterium sp. NKUCC04_CG]|uniref:glutamate racemase n=1 Tax=Flavobacterium sp. NKUCC04_CG TaxID=2842121 RepID=UPI001C5BBA2E|nr:glutamate racemase [Flavobacterium sp. NKUCC04_CG]MBW3518208.1 glutamate racemase [Flavobacterium sp. NKUCC04_CG]
MDNTKPIGLFDSGIGGTTICKEVNLLLPYENTIYLADSKNAPYGQRTKEQIIALSIKNIDYLISQHCKLIIVACNTATTNAISELRAKYSLPIIGIEPAVKPATILTKTAVIGVLATKGTLTSELFSNTVKKYSDIVIVEQIGYDLVKLIEEGKINDPEMDYLLQQYLEPMVIKGMDTLVLGCTHYPYLISKIKKLIPEHINIIDSGAAVAKHTRKVLEENNLLNTGKTIGKRLFYTNKEVEILRLFVEDKSSVHYLDF